MYKFETKTNTSIIYKEIDNLYHSIIKKQYIQLLIILLEHCYIYGFNLTLNNAVFMITYLNGICLCVKLHTLYYLKKKREDFLLLQLKIIYRIECFFYWYF